MQSKEGIFRLHMINEEELDKKKCINKREHPYGIDYLDPRLLQLSVIAYFVIHLI